VQTPSRPRSGFLPALLVIPLVAVVWGVDSYWITRAESSWGVWGWLCLPLIVATPPLVYFWGVNRRRRRAKPPE
jgi:hypothetical protein